MVSCPIKNNCVRHCLPSPCPLKPPSPLYDENQKVYVRIPTHPWLFNRKVNRQKRFRVVCAPNVASFKQKSLCGEVKVRSEVPTRLSNERKKKKNAFFYIYFYKTNN